MYRPVGDVTRLRLKLEYAGIRDKIISEKFKILISRHEEMSVISCTHWHTTQGRFVCSVGKYGCGRRVTVVV